MRYRLNISLTARKYLYSFGRIHGLISSPFQDYYKVTWGIAKVIHFLSHVPVENFADNRSNPVEDTIANLTGQARCFNKSEDLIPLFINCSDISALQERFKLRALHFGIAPYKYQALSCAGDYVSDRALKLQASSHWQDSLPAFFVGPFITAWGENLLSLTLSEVEIDKLILILWPVSLDTTRAHATRKYRFKLSLDTDS